MKGRETTILVILFLSTFTNTFAANCYGGSIESTRIIGGSGTDIVYGLVTAKNDIILSGYTGSPDFPADKTYGENGTNVDCIISIASISNSSLLSSIIVSGNSSDIAYFADVDGDYICISGATTSGSTFPVTSPYSYNNYSNSAFLLTLNSSNPNAGLLMSTLLGNDRDMAETTVACSAESQTAFLVSMAYSQNYHTDLRITAVNINDGSRIADYFYGDPQSNENFYAADAFKISNNRYLMVAGYTDWSGINDSLPLPNAYQSRNNGSSDGFIMMFNVNNPSSISPRFGTFLGGSQMDTVSDATVDELGNTYVVGVTYSQDFPLKNEFNSNNNVTDGSGLFLSIFNLQGQLLISSYGGVNAVGWAAVAVSALPDGGHLVYITGYTSDVVNGVEKFENIPAGNRSIDNADAFIKVLYINAQFTAAEVRLETLFGGSSAENVFGITVLPNNKFAISGITVSTDIPQANLQVSGSDVAAFVTTFTCGEGLYAVSTPSPTPIPNPSPSNSPVSSTIPSASPISFPSINVPSSSPISSSSPSRIPASPSPSSSTIPPPSPPPVTCEATDGCYSVSETTVVFETGDDGEYTPSQTLFVGSQETVEPTYYLSVQYSTLEEFDFRGNLVKTVSFPSSGYTLESEYQIINGVNVSVVTFSAVLDNGAGVDVINYFFQESGTLDFAGTSVFVDKGTSKASLRIYDWSFEDEANTLTLAIRLNIAPPPKGEATSSSSGNQTQFTWDTGATSCVVTTLSVVEVDGGIGTSSLQVSSTTLLVTFSSFVDYVLYDPGYAVLVKDEESSSPKEEVSPWAYVGSALGAVVVVGVGVSIGFVFMRRRRRRTQTALSARPPMVEVEMK